MRLSLFVLAVLAVLAIFAPWMSPYPFDEQNIAHRLLGPTWNHWMGTDHLGRDLLSRILFGAQISLGIGLTTAFAALIIGTSVGLISGYFGGWMDHILTKITEILSIFPLLLLAIVLTLFLGRGLTWIFFAIAASTWVLQARLVRAATLQVKSQNFILAAKSIGASPWRVMIFHILPALRRPILVSLGFQIPSNILTESFLSFVGLGLQPPYASWGTLANEGLKAMVTYPHLIAFPGFFLFITLLAFNHLGESLSDRWDSSSGIKDHLLVH